MDNKKFEQLIELIINEDEEKARALFHDIVVEKSREIYESLMDEEMVDSPVEGLMDEISAEEAGGMTEEEDEFADIEADGEEDGAEIDVDLDADDMDGGEGEEDLEDRVVDLEDKLDELMAEFEEMMNKESGDMEAGDDDMMEAKHDDDDSLEEGKEDDDALEEAKHDDDDALEEAQEDDTLEESVQLQKVSVSHGDNGVQTKSPTLGANSKVGSNGAKAVAMGGGDGGKGGTQGGLLNPTTKDLKGAGSFKNSPGAGKFNEKGEAAPKPKHGDDGQNKKSPLGESKKPVKKIVR